MILIRLFFFICFFCISPLLGQEMEQVSSSLSSSSSSSSFSVIKRKRTEESFKFRIGFEFQLVSADLFLHYKDNKRLQKKPLFHCLESSGKPLWHAEIDGANIEFVTQPFSHEEKEDLTLCLQSIEHACINLRAFVNRNTDEIFFFKWVEEFTKELAEKSENTLTTNWTREIDQKELRKLYMERPEQKWQRLFFQPQATLQHPLEYTIPIAFALFGFDKGWNTKHLLTGLPDYDQKSDILENFDNFNRNVTENTLKTKMHGLSFLHALTMMSMTIRDSTQDFRTKLPDEPETDYENAYFLFEISKKLTSCNQVDPKDRITLMSRRPFSSMYANIRAMEPTSYYQFFKTHIEDGNGYFRIGVPRDFFKTNYAEQFFDDYGKPKDISHLSRHLQEDFYTKNRQVIDGLLEKGVASTAMIRNFVGYPSFLNNFYENAIRSVDNPQAVPTFRLVTNPALNQSPIEEMHNSGYDVLSPPWFLDEGNSMGAFKKDANYDIVQYGEAIIEYRAIAEVGSFFRKKSKLRGEMGHFLKQLKKPSQIVEEGVKLLDFLNNFKDDDFLNEVNRGIAYLVIKDVVPEEE